MNKPFSYAKLNNDTEFEYYAGTPRMIIPSGTIVRVYISAEILGIGITEYTLFCDGYWLDVLTEDLASVIDTLEPLPSQLDD